MHNRIGRRAAVAGVDRMAVEDVVASVLHFLPNEDAIVLRRATGAGAAMRRVPAMVGTRVEHVQISDTEDCPFPMGRAIARATACFVPMSLAARGNAGALPTRGQLVRYRS